MAVGGRSARGAVNRSRQTAAAPPQWREATGDRVSCARLAPTTGWPFGTSTPFWVRSVQRCASDAARSLVEPAPPLRKLARTDKEHGPPTRSPRPGRNGHVTVGEHAFRCHIVTEGCALPPGCVKGERRSRRCGSPPMPSTVPMIGPMWPAPSLMRRCTCPAERHAGLPMMRSPWSPVGPARRCVTLGRRQDPRERAGVAPGRTSCWPEPARPGLLHPAYSWRRASIGRSVAARLAG